MKNNKLLLGFSPPKCGTTSLYKALVLSQSISEGRLKEPRFFAYSDHPGFGELPSGLETTGSYENGREWFDSLFSDNCEYSIDFTTYYAIYEEPPLLALHEFDEVKGVCVLRDPIQRFISHYFQYAKVGINVPSLDDTINKNNDFSKFMFRFSNYKKLLNHYRESLGAENTILLDFNDLKNRENYVENQLNDFLGIKDFSYRPTEKTMNVAGKPRFGGLPALLFNPKLRATASKLNPAVKTRLLTARKKLIKLNTKNAAYPVPTSSSMELLRERLGEDIEFYEETFNNSAEAVKKEISSG